MRKIHIALKGIAEDIAKEVMHDPVMKELCHISLQQDKGADSEEDAVVMPLSEIKAKGIPTLWLNSQVRALVSNDVLSAEQMLARTFLLSLVRTVPYNKDMTTEEMSLYDAILCASDEEKESVFEKYPTQGIVAVALNDEEVCVAPVRGIDWHVAEEDAPNTNPHSNDTDFHTALDATRLAIYTAIDITRAREQWDEARENPLPKLFVEKKPRKEGGNPPFKPVDE